MFISAMHRQLLKHVIKKLYTDFYLFKLFSSIQKQNSLKSVHHNMVLLLLQSNRVVVEFI